MIIITLLLLTGCNQTEVTERVFVKAVYADKTEDNIYLDILFTTPSGDEKIFSSKGKDFKSSLISAEKIIGKDIFTEHCRVVFVGAGIRNINKDLSYLAESNKFSPETIICICGYRNVLSAENLDDFADILEEEKGRNYGTVFSGFSGRNKEYPIATLKKGFIILL